MKRHVFRTWPTYTPWSWLLKEFKTGEWFSFKRKYGRHVTWYLLSMFTCQKERKKQGGSPAPRGWPSVRRARMRISRLLRAACCALFIVMRGNVSTTIPTRKQLFLASGTWLKEPALETYGPMNESCVPLLEPSPGTIYTAAYSAPDCSILILKQCIILIFLFCLPPVFKHYVKHCALVYFLLDRTWPDQAVDFLLLGFHPIAIKRHFVKLLNIHLSM